MVVVKGGEYCGGINDGGCGGCGGCGDDDDGDDDDAQHKLPF